MTTPEAVAEKLNGTLKKFTVTVLFKDGRSIEIQTDVAARTTFDVTSRDAFLQFGYSEETMIRISDLSGWVTTPNHQ